MIAVVLVLLAVIVGVGAVMMTHTDAGYVLISFGPWVAETTFVALLISIVVCCLIIYTLSVVLSATWTLPGGLRNALVQHRANRSQKAFNNGMLHLLEGRWKQAEVELVRHAADNPAAYLNYIAAARAAQRLGAAERRDHYLQLAAENIPETTRRNKKRQDSGQIAALITRAELQRERGEYRAVKATAEALRALDESNPYAIELLAEAQTELGEWSALLKLLEEAPARQLEQPRRQALQLRALTALLDSEAAHGSLDRLKQTWKSAGDLQQDARLRITYTRGLLRLGADDEARAQIVKLLDKDWNADCARLCARLQGVDPVALLADIERWIQRHGERPELLLAAGHASIEAQMWGKAQSYLDAVQRAAPSARVHLELARLAERTRQPEQAARHYREGLELASKTDIKDSDSRLTATPKSLPPPTEAQKA